MELLVSYNGPRESSLVNVFPRCGETVATDWTESLRHHGAKLNQSGCQRLTAGISIQHTSSPADELFCVNTIWHLITHCVMDDSLAGGC